MEFEFLRKNLYVYFKRNHTPSSLYFNFPFFPFEGSATYQFKLNMNVDNCIFTNTIFLPKKKGERNQF